LTDFKEKCKILNIKDYGTKDKIEARIEKHYIDNDLGKMAIEHIFIMGKKTAQSIKYAL
jgi:hypothetical protein